MLKRMIIGATVLAAIGVGAAANSPTLRAKLQQQWADWTGWAQEARQADPVGFAEYARKKLKRDIEVMERTRRELAAEVGGLSRKIRGQQALADQAQMLAEEFRDRYQATSSDGGFPIEIREAAYTEAQAKSQVSMLLAEAEGYKDSLVELKKVQQEAESRMEALAVRINTTEAQLAALSAKREVLRARLLSDEGEQLLTQVDDLMTGNARLLQGNPVRTTRELLTVETTSAEKPVSAEKVEAFLAQKAPPKKDSAGEEAANRQVVEPVAAKLPAAQAEEEPAQQILNNPQPEDGGTEQVDEAAPAEAQTDAVVAEESADEVPIKPETTPATGQSRDTGPGKPPTSPAPRNRARNANRAAAKPQIEEVETQRGAETAPPARRQVRPPRRQRATSAPPKRGKDDVVSEETSAPVKAKPKKPIFAQF